MSSCFVWRSWHSNSDWKFYMQKYDKQIFAVFYVNDKFLNICCFIVTVLSGRGGICLTSFNNSTPKTPLDGLEGSLRYLLHKPSHCLFFSNFLAKATHFGCGRIFLTSLNSPIPKTPWMCKDLGHISYTSWVIDYFVSNFVAMATGVNSQTPTTPY